MLTFQALISAGADVAVADSAGRTPVHLSCLHAQWDILRSLLARGASPNVTDDVGISPLALCSLHEDGIVGAQLLLDSKADPNLASNTSQPTNGKSESENHASKEKEDAESDEDRLRLSHPLIAAACAGDEPLLSLLLSKGASVLSTGSDGSSALLMAARYGSVGVVTALLAAGAQPTEAILLAAVRAHAATVVKALLMHDLPPEKAAVTAALRVAVQAGDAGSVAHLALAAPTKGCTALHIACALGDETCARLLAQPERVNILDDSGTFYRCCFIFAQQT